MHYIRTVAGSTISAQTIPKPTKMQKIVLSWEIVNELMKFQVIQFLQHFQIRPNDTIRYIICSNISFTQTTQVRTVKF